MKLGSPMNKKSLSYNRMMNIVIALLIGIILACAVYITYKVVGYKQGVEAYQSIRKKAVTLISSPPVSTKKGTSSTQNSKTVTSQGIPNLTVNFNVLQHISKIMKAGFTAGMAALIIPFCKPIIISFICIIYHLENIIFLVPFLSMQTIKCLLQMTIRLFMDII
jgi:hypothetical protein